MPAEALAILQAESGAILDVGGGAAPYHRASHVLDILEFDAARLAGNAWGSGKGEAASGKREEEGREREEERGRPRSGWDSSQHTKMDLCAGKKWPFEDGQFDLGLCSHTLEDLRDPLPAVRELCRVSKRVLIITPSRLAEQTLGMEHPRYCGFYHHPWMVYGRGKQLVFRRKTPMVQMPGCHIVCPFGKKMKLEYGASYFLGEEFEPEEEAFFSEEGDRDDYARFVATHGARRDLFEDDPARSGWRHRVWRIRQKWLGHV